MVRKPNREWSLSEIQAYKQVKNLDPSPFEKVADEEYYFRVDDPSPDSVFQFVINDFDLEQGRIFISALWMPGEESKVDATEFRFEITQFKTYYDAWVRRIHLYNQYLLEEEQDTIVEGYELEIDLDIAEDDADTHSFTEPKQVLIDTYLHKIAEQLNEYKKTLSFSEEINQEIDIIIADIDRLRATQHRQTKRKVVNKVKNIMARYYKAIPVPVRKLGEEVSKTMLIDFLGMFNEVCHFLSS